MLQFSNYLVVKLKSSIRTEELMLCTKAEGSSSKICKLKHLSIFQSSSFLKYEPIHEQGGGNPNVCTFLPTLTIHLIALPAFQFKQTKILEMASNITTVFLFSLSKFVIMVIITQWRARKNFNELYFDLLQ